METRADYIMVGAFTLVIAVAALGFVFWFHHTIGQGAASVHRIVFGGSSGWR